MEPSEAGERIVESGTYMVFDGIMQRELPYDIVVAGDQEFTVTYTLPISDARIRETKEPYVVGEDGLKYSTTHITLLLLAPVMFHPQEETDIDLQDDTGENGPAANNFISPSDKFSEAIAMRDFAFHQLDRIMRTIPPLRRYLLSFTCRKLLYQAYVSEEDVVNIEGRLVLPRLWTEDDDSTHDIDTPHPPHGSNVRTQTLPGDWYKRFVHTVFANFWIEWCTHCSYRTHRLLWSFFAVSDNVSYDTHTLAMSSFIENIAYNFEQLNDPYTLLPLDYSRGSWVVENSEMETERIRTMATRTARLQRTPGALAHRHPITGPSPSVQVLSSRLNWYTTMMQRRAALPPDPNGDPITMPYDKTSLWTMVRAGIICPGRNGGMFSNPEIMNLLEVMFRNRNDRETQLQFLKATLQSPEGVPRTSWRCGSVSETMRTFGKSPDPSVAISAYDAPFIESYRHLELLIVPTVAYQIVPGVTDIVNELFPCDFEIGQLPNDARVVFRPPIAMSVTEDGMSPDTPINIDLGFVGSRRGTTFRLGNAWLANVPDTETAISAHFGQAFGNQQIRVEVRDVRYGPLSIPRPYPISYDDDVPGILSVGMHPTNLNIAHIAVYGVDRTAFTVRGLAIVSPNARGEQRITRVGSFAPPSRPMILPELVGRFKLLMGTYYYQRRLLTRSQARNYATPQPGSVSK